MLHLVRVDELNNLGFFFILKYLAENKDRTLVLYIGYFMQKAS